MDLALTSTQAAILLELQEAGTPVFAESIAKKFNLSSGVVRYNITTINDWLKHRFDPIISRPKYGYKFELASQRVPTLMDELNHTRIQPVYNSAERQQLLMFHLLLAPDYVPLEKLSIEVGMSKQTLMREMYAVEEYLGKHHLYLMKKPHLGTRVVGPENAIRHTLIMLIMEVIPEAVLIKLIQWGVYDAINKEAFLRPVRKAFTETLRKLDLQGSMRLVNRMEEDLDLKVGDNRFLYHILYWAISVQRAAGGNTVSLPEALMDISFSENETRVLEQTIMGYKKESGQRVNPAEATMFLLEMLSSPLLTQQDALPSPYLSKPDDLRATLLVTRLVNGVAESTGFRMTDPSIIEKMARHISKMLVRLKFNLPIENPFAKEVRSTYPEMWLATQSAVAGFDPDLAVISEEEIAFIAMYFVLASQLESKDEVRPHPRVVVVCPTGGVSVWMLVSRLKAELPSIEIIANVSLRELNRIDRKQVNAIITTAHNITDKDLPVICVSPFLSKDDITQVKASLRNYGFQV